MSGYTGAIFDVDGVLVDSPHEEAWRESLRELMAGPWADIVGQTSYSPEKFTPALYHERMSGKPRTAGATAALEYFGVPDIDRRVKEYGEHKQEMIIRLISEGRFSAYDDAVRFVLAVRNVGHPGRGGVVVEERQDVPREDRPVPLRRHRQPAPGVRRRRLGPRLRPRQAGPRDLPDRRAGARRRARGARSSPRTPSTASRPRRPAGSGPSGCRAPTTSTRSRPRAPTSSSPTWARSTCPRSGGASW